MLRGPACDECDPPAQPDGARLPGPAPPPLTECLFVAYQERDIERRVIVYEKTPGFRPGPRIRSVLVHRYTFYEQAVSVRDGREISGWRTSPCRVLRVAHQPARHGLPTVLATPPQPTACS